MSDINIGFTVDSSNINVVVEPNDITFTPTDISLNIFSGSFSIPAGSSGQLQYNNGGVFGGVANTSFSGGIFTLGPVANVSITGGTNGQFLQTNGSNVLSWATVDTANANTANFANYANFAGTAYSVAGANVTGTVANANYAAYAGNVTIAGQANITSLGTLTSLNVSGTSNLTTLNVNGTSNLSAVGNVKIIGGTNGQFLQTDGTGNLAWVSGGGTGNGVVGGSNTQVQYNNAGNFAGSTAFIFNDTTNTLSVTNTTTAIKTMPYGTEKVDILAAPTSTYNLNILTQSIVYATGNANANVTLNVRGNSSVTANSLVAVGDSLTTTYVMTSNATPFAVSAMQIDGSSQTVKWVNGSTPVGIPNTVTAFTFTAIKTASTPTYTVFGGATRYA